MKIRKLLLFVLSAILLIAAVACAKPTAPAPKAEPTSEPVAEADSIDPTEAPQAEPARTEKPVETEAAEETESAASSDPVKVAALVGPTGVGLAYLNKLSAAYDLSLFTAPDQVTAKIVNGEVDIAAVPINLASVLYNKTQGGISVIAVNTLGVLYVVENGDTVHTIEDLAGKTIYAAGQGSTPQYILEQILSQNDLTDKVTVTYIAETTELVAKLIAGDEVKLAFIPEPQVSNACMKSETTRVALSANDLWAQNNQADIVQGVYIVRNDFLKEHPDLIDQFLQDAAESVAHVLNDEDAAATVVEAGIIPAEPIAKRAIPNCNIVLKTGSEMKQMVSAMLQTLFDANPKSVGGTMPGDEFYYVP